MVDVLNAYGAKVAALDIDAEGGARAVASAGDEARFWPVDITDDAPLERGLAQVARHFGRLDYLDRGF